MNETQIFNELLKRSDKKQVEIAEELGTSRQHVTSWKNGSKGISLKKLHKIATFMGLKILIRIAKK